VGENTGVEFFTIYYTDDKNQKLYTSTVQVIPNVNELKWKVRLHGIPIDDGKGREVVVNWELEDFDNGGVFYTDSNGLEM